MDADNAAALRFFRIVRRFCARAKPGHAGIVYVDTNPAEGWDATKLSQRVYGNRHEFLAVMAACGLDQVSETIKQQRVVLPTPGKLMQLKMDAGFESDPKLRQDGKPVWVR